MHSLTQWVAALSARNLPVLRQTAQDIGQLRVRGEAVTGREVAQVVLRDPLMTLNLLRFSQARLRHRAVSEMTTVEHVIMMHGMNAFFRQFRELVVIEEELGAYPDALLGMRRALSRAWFAGVCARVFAGLRNDMEAEEVMISALLHDFGDLLLWCIAPRQALQIEQMHTLQRAVLRAAAQRLVLGFTLRELQHAVVQQWGLPALLRQHVHPEHVAHPRLDTMKLTVALTRHAERGWHHSALPEEYPALAKLTNLSVEQCVHWVHQASVQAARNWRCFGVRPAAANLPLLPGPVLPPPAPIGGRIPEAVEEVLGQLAAANPRSSEDRATTVAALFYALSSGLGLRRVWLGRVNPTSGKVEPANVLLLDPGLTPGELSFEPGSTHLFARLLPRVQSLWFTGSNRQRLATLLPSPLREKLISREFFAMSLHVKGTPFGLLYADSGTQPAVFDEARYGDFKRTCLAFVAAVERASA